MVPSQINLGITPVSGFILELRYLTSLVIVADLLDYSRRINTERAVFFALQTPLCYSCSDN